MKVKRRELLGTISPSTNSKEGLKKEDERSEQDHRQTSDGLNVDSSCSTSAGRCWGWIGSSGGRTTRRRGAHGLGFESVKGVPSGGGIDRKHHPAGAMAALSTVHPERSGLIDANGVSGEGGGIGADRVKPRVKAICHGTARTGESGLSGRMVFHVELKSDGVSRLGGNGVRLERKKAGTAYDNLVVRPGGGG